MTADTITDRLKRINYYLAEFVINKSDAELSELGRRIGEIMNVQGEPLPILDDVILCQYYGNLCLDIIDEDKNNALELFKTAEYQASYFILRRILPDKNIANLSEDFRQRVFEVMLKKANYNFIDKRYRAIKNLQRLEII